MNNTTASCSVGRRVKSKILFSVDSGSQGVGAPGGELELMFSPLASLEVAEIAEFFHPDLESRISFFSVNSGSRGAGAPGGEPNRILPPASLEVTGGFNHDWTRIYHLFFVVSFCSGFLTEDNERSEGE